MLKKLLATLMVLPTLLGCFYGCGNTNSLEEISAPTTESTETTEIYIPFDGEYVSGELLNYFYMDAVQQQYSVWKQTFGDSAGEYLRLYFNLDITKALDLQIYDQAQGITWADYFTQIAKKDASASLAIFETAKADGYKLSEGARSEFDGWVKNYETYAQLYSITPDAFIESNYGKGMTFAGWKEYLNIVITAQDYAANYANSLTFDEAALQKAESGREAEFSAYSFATYHITYNKYPQFGTKAEDGNVNFDDAQKKTALEAAKTDAQSLTAADSVEKLNALIAGLACNSASKDAACTVKENTAYSEISELFRPWLTDPARKPGDCTVIANESVIKSEDGSETKVLNGYYVVLFTDINDNKRPLANVRHLLVLSEKDDAAAKKKAEELLAQWEKDPTEKNFIALVKEHSDDSSAEYGGLFEDLAPNSPYVPEFLDWSLDENRIKGDCDIVKTQYGYHLMYYVGDDETTYRDLLISQELEEKAYNAWYTSVVEAFDVTFADESKINRSYIISPAS